MKRLLFFVIVLVLVICAGVTYAQRIVKIGDLPKSDAIINIYQVFGFQEGDEGYKITYVGNNNEPQHLYIPIELLNTVRIYTPQASTFIQNFLIIWRKGDVLTQVEWFKPQAIDYRLPNYSLEPFQERDKEIFRAVVDNGELVLGTEISGIAPIIRAPGGE